MSVSKSIVNDDAVPSCNAEWNTSLTLKRNRVEERLDVNDHRWLRLSFAIQDILLRTVHVEAPEED